MDPNSLFLCYFILSCSSLQSFSYRSHCRLAGPHHAVDEVEDGGRFPAWTQKKNALFSVVPPAVCSWRSGSLHLPAGSVSHGPAARPRFVSSIIELATESISLFVHKKILSVANSAAVNQEYLIFLNK